MHQLHALLQNQLLSYSMDPAAAVPEMLIVEFCPTHLSNEPVLTTALY